MWICQYNIIGMFLRRDGISLLIFITHTGGCCAVIAVA